MRSVFGRGCAWMLSLTVLLALGPVAAAQSGPGLLRPWEDKRFIELEFSGQVQLEGEAEKTDDDFQLIRYTSKGRLRFDNERRQGALAIGYDIDYLAMDTDHPTLSGYSPFDFSVGIASPIYKVDNVIFTANVAVGYAGTNAFTDADAIYAKAHLGAIWNIDETMTLSAGIEYNGNRTVLPDVPLPTISFRHILSEEFTYIVGFPLNGVIWTPMEDLTLSAFYVPPYGGRAYVGYKVFDEFEVYAELGGSTRAYNIDGDSSSQRVFFRRRYVEAGFKWEIYQLINFNFAVGYAFSQKFSTGWHTLNDQKITDISNEPYIRIRGVLFF